MVSNVTAATDATVGAAAMKKATGMNKDDFLKLFVTQLQHQDPLNPQDGAQFIAQLAQLTQVEQAYNTNSNLQKLMDLQNTGSLVSTVSFIGKEVLAAGSQFALSGGAPVNLGFRLAAAAQQVNVDIKNATGAVVKSLTLGATPAGDSQVAWDGTGVSGALLPAGSYSFAVTALDASGNRTAGISLVRGKVDGVRLDGTNPTVTVGGVEVPLTDVYQVQGG